jgi:DNA primase
VTLSPQWLDELRARTTLSTIISPTVKLIRAGREWKACCPFHNEKTPSFTINDDKGFYHCLAAETVVVTRRGKARICDLAGNIVEVLGPSGRWIRAPFRHYGEQQLWRIELARKGARKAIFATSHHRWFIDGVGFEFLTHQLPRGATLLANVAAPRSNWELDPAGVRHGILFFDALNDRRPDGPADLRDATVSTNVEEVPDRASSDAYLLGFIAGCLAAGGNVSADGLVTLESTRREPLVALRSIAAALGIATYGIEGGHKVGAIGCPPALCSLCFEPSALVPELLLEPGARQKFEQARKAHDPLGWSVVSTEPTERVERVYCSEVPEDHAFALDDDIVTGNCFGCGAHGDAIRFLTDHRGMPFIDAVKELAAKAGMDVPAPDPQSKERADRAASLTDVMAQVATYYSEQLNGTGGAEARDYLKRRGLDSETIARFGLGFAPDGRTTLRRALGKLGEEKLVETGMLIKPEGGGSSYDRFRGRLMFPIRDARRRVIGFGGRILGQGEPKYLNSPDTPLFDKGRTLYNLDRASPASRAARRLIVVEGYMDVIALDRAGIAEVVAPNGTALTEAQLERMWRLDPSPILCFDGDSAGRKAAVRAAARALPLIRPDRTLRFVELPPGQDPDDVIRIGGREAFEALLDKCEPLDFRLWRNEVEAQPLTTPEALAGLRQRLLDHAAAISDPTLARLYREQWLDRFAGEVESRRSHAGRTGGRPLQRSGRFAPPPPAVGPHARAIASSGIDGPTARALILGFANFPEELAAHCEQLAALAIADSSTAKMRDELVNAAFSGATLDRQTLGTILGTDGAMGSKGLRTMGFSFTRRDSDPDRARSDLAAAVEIIAAAEEVDRALEDATERLKRDTTDEAFEEQQRLKRAQLELRQRLAQLAGTD